MGGELTEAQVIRALKRLSDGWPEGYTLFSWSGSLLLIRPGGIDEHSGVLRSKVADTFPGITNGGGDPEDIDDGEVPDA